MALPSESEKLLSTLTAKFIVTVVHKLSVTRRYKKATADQQWIAKEMIRYSNDMGTDQLNEIETQLGTLEAERKKLEIVRQESVGIVGVLTIRKYRKVRRYQKATEQVKETVRMASDYARIVEMQRLLLQQNLNETSGQVDVQSETQTEPAPPNSNSAPPDSNSAPPDSNSAPPDSNSTLPDLKSASPDSNSATPDSNTHARLSIIGNKNSPSEGTDQGISMQAIVENDPNHLYTATFTTHNTEIKEKHDATTGTFIPTYRIRTETVVYGELYRGDRSGASAEAPVYKVPTVRQSRAAKATARVRKGRSVDKSGAAKKAATVHKPNATRIHARSETDATINVADTSDGVSSDAADSDGPSLSTEFGGSTTYSEIGERMDLNGYEVVETLDIAIGADSL